MKKLFTFLALVLGLVSCQTEPEGFDVNAGGEQDVNITVSLPEGTRANANSAEGAFANVDLGTEDDTKTIRYILKIYQKVGNEYVASNDRQVEYSDGKSVVFPVRLVPNRDYRFVVWADYVDVNSMSDKYYDTRDFSEIILSDKEGHSGSNDYRDAFRGYATATVINPDYYTGTAVNSIDNQATAEMKRPMGKFKFVSTDMEVFLTRVAQMMKEQGKLMNVSADANTKAYYEQLLQNINIGDFYVVFRYNVFMPCSFNMFTDKPADSWTGVSFISSMYPDEGLLEMTLGYDYIFVNGSETTLSISLEVYNKEGELMSSTNPINVPIVRSKITVVKGEFLTSKATGGVTINPGYDGDDYNIEIK